MSNCYDGHIENNTNMKKNRPLKIYFFKGCNPDNQRYPQSTLYIKVWDSNLVVDSFLGQCNVDAKESSDPDNPFGEDASR